MEVKVVLYRERADGAPFDIMSSPIYGDVTKFDDLKPLVLECLNQDSMFLPNQEIITQVSAYGISRMLDLINIQEYLKEQGYILLVNSVNSKFDYEGKSGYFIEVISPALDSGIGDSVIYYSEDQNYSLLDIVSDIKNRYGLGDPGLVPNSKLSSLLDVLEDMKAKGMPIYDVYISQLQSFLIDYGFNIFYVYIQ